MERIHKEHQIALILLLLTSILIAGCINNQIITDEKSNKTTDVKPSSEVNLTAQEIDDGLDEALAELEETK